MLTECLTRQCAIVPDARHGLLSLQTDPALLQATAVHWPADAEPPAELFEAAAAALARRVPVVIQRAAGALAGESAATQTAEGPPPGTEAPNAQAVADIALPLIENRRVWGVIAVRTGADATRHQSIMQMLRWGGSWLELLQADSQAKLLEASATERENVAARHVVRIADACLAEPDVRVARVQLCVALAREFDCASVSLGRIHNGSTEVVASSNGAVVERHAALVRSTEAAMDEALDQGLSIATPAPNGAQPSSRLAQQALLANSGNAAVLCVPVLAHDEPVAVVCLEFARPDLLTPVCVEAMAFAAPTLGLLIDNLATRSGANRTRLFGWARGSPGLVRAAGLISLAALAAALHQVPQAVHVKAPAVIEGAVQRAVVAPFDGYVSGANVRAGETVRKGQALAELDKADLVLALRRLEGDRGALAQRHRRAFASLDSSEAGILDAQLEQTDARIALVRTQLARADLVAPFDGTVVRGDLSRALGRPVTRGEVLFEVAPLDRYRVAMQLDAKDIARVRESQRGRLRLTALPDQELEVEVHSISATGTDDAGGPSFRVEATLLADDVGLLRPGMQGVARLGAGQQSMLTAWLGPPFTALANWWWSVAP